MQKSSRSVDYCVAREEFETELHTVFGNWFCGRHPCRSTSVWGKAPKAQPSGQEAELCIRTPWGLNLSFARGSLGSLRKVTQLPTYNGGRILTGWL